MEVKLKNALPTFEICDATNKNSDEITEIIKSCESMENLLVFLIRNETNGNFFEELECKKTDENCFEELECKTDVIVYNRDDCYYYNTENIDHTIMSVKRKVCGDIDCVICTELCEDNYLMCSKCGHQLHFECLQKWESREKICPICRNDIFLRHEK